MTEGPSSHAVCGQCGEALREGGGWTCAACAADLHDVGIVGPQPLRRKLRDSLRVVGQRLRGRRQREPGCMACQYPVQGLTGFTCPECGANLLEVGAMTPRFSGAAVLLVLLMLALWTAAIGVAGVFGHDLLRRHSPREYTASLTIKTTSDRNPPPVKIELELVGQVQAQGWPRQPVPAIAQLAGTLSYDDGSASGGGGGAGGTGAARAVVHIVYDVATKQTQYYLAPPDAGPPAEGTVHAADLDASMVRDALRLLGLDPDAAEMDEDIALMLEGVDGGRDALKQHTPATFASAVISGGYGSTSSFGVQGATVWAQRVRNVQLNQNSNTVRWPGHVFSIAVVLVWLLGIALLLMKLLRRGRRRPIGGLKAAPAQGPV